MNMNMNMNMNMDYRKSKRNMKAYVTNDGTAY
jgi:hypothetical protein